MKSNKNPYVPEKSTNINKKQDTTHGAESASTLKKQPEVNKTIKQDNLNIGQQKDKDRF